MKVLVPLYGRRCNPRRPTTILLSARHLFSAAPIIRTNDGFDARVLPQLSQCLQEDEEKWVSRKTCWHWVGFQIVYMVWGFLFFTPCVMFHTPCNFYFSKIPLSLTLIITHVTAAPPGHLIPEIKLRIRKKNKFRKTTAV